MNDADRDKVRTWVARCIGAVLLLGITAGLWHVIQVRAAARALAELDKDMRAIGLALNAYAAGDDDGYFPPVSPRPGVLFFDAASMFPVYLENPGVAVSPRRPNGRALERRLRAATDDDERTEAAAIEEVGAESYYYLGYFVENEAAVRAFAEAYRAAIAEDGAPPGMDSTVPGDDGEGASTLYRLREGGMPGQSAPRPGELPVLIERPPSEGAAIRVLFMDGHRANVPHGEFPNLPGVTNTLTALEEFRAGNGMAPAVRVP